MRFHQIVQRCDQCKAHMSEKSSHRTTSTSSTGYHHHHSHSDMGDDGAIAGNPSPQPDPLLINAALQLCSDGHVQQLLGDLSRYYHRRS